ncbi:hypothetical protein DW352_18920 [Pseudolabrys taiwanensis]|uniref:Uncharacterized protein n=1 Tax=Pseudolabrys taiwanensis TaxID=331696 RepID=A0A345ZZR0_9HYPH|nr:hypothetical protein [Pseudolabrys taiwanensis]AXK82407.1 hypothetical protein DW352_18920 [Pseudolabrys taiwanensis]
MACLSLGGLYLGARIGLAPRDPSASVAVIFPPWTSAADTVAQSVAHRGRFMRFGGVPFIAVVMPDDDHYADETLATGAWLVLDSRLLAACAGVFSPLASAT